MTNINLTDIDDTEDKILSLIRDLEDQIINIREHLEDRNQKLSFTYYYVDSLRDSLKHLDKTYNNLISEDYKIDRKLISESNCSVE